MKLLKLLSLSPLVAANVFDPLLVQRPATQLFPVERIPSVTPQDLHSLSSGSFSSFSHPQYPNHQVRIKETKGFCDPTVKTYTGYIDIEHGRKHLFFYFFESRRDPEQDDVLLWINGGPGGSSALGLLTELGPCNIEPSSKNGTAWNPWGWNRNANLLFLDQPISVGYSHGSSVSLPRTAQEAAVDVHAFLTIWFSTFSAFKSRPFHFAGESYGGRYIPVFASHIWDMNQKVEREEDKINLKSVMIGNGWTNPIKIHGSYYEMLCKNSAVVPFYSIEMCAELVYTAPECEKRLTKSCGRNANKYDCRAAASYCETELMLPFLETGRNWYDISDPCNNQSGDEGLGCYPQIDQIVKYLSKNSTKDMLGVSRDQSFEEISTPLHEAFVQAGDMYEVSDPYVVGLLERDVRVLIYVGANDLACNFVGNYRTVQDLDWSDSKCFSERALENWSVPNEFRDNGLQGSNGTLAGETKTSCNGRLTFTTVRGAGHLVPFDKPVEAAWLVERWLAEKPL